MHAPSGIEHVARLQAPEVRVHHEAEPRDAVAAARALRRVVVDMQAQARQALDDGPLKGQRLRLLALKRVMSST